MKTKKTGVRLLLPVPTEEELCLRMHHHQLCSPRSAVFRLKKNQKTSPKELSVHLAALVPFSSGGKGFILDCHLLCGPHAGVKGCEVVAKVLGVSGTRWGHRRARRGAGGLSTPPDPAVGLALSGSTHVSSVCVLSRAFAALEARFSEGCAGAAGKREPRRLFHAVWRKVCLQSPIPRL